MSAGPAFNNVSHTLPHFICSRLQRFQFSQNPQLARTSRFKRSLLAKITKCVVFDSAIGLEFAELAGFSDCLRVVAIARACRLRKESCLRLPVSSLFYPSRVARKILFSKGNLFLLNLLTKANILSPAKLTLELSRAREWKKLSLVATSSKDPFLSAVTPYLSRTHQATGNGKLEVYEQIRENVGQLSRAQIERLADKGLDYAAFFTQVGLFKAALFFRLIGLERLATKKKPLSRSSHLAAFELEMYGHSSRQVVFQWFTEAAPLQVSPSFDLTSHKLLELLQGEAKRLRRLSVISGALRNPRNVLPVVLRPFGPGAIAGLQGKEILLVGPKLSETEANDFDSADAVARPGFLGPETVSAYQEKGTQIALFRDHKIAKLSKAKTHEIFNQVATPILSNLSWKTLRKLEERPEWVSSSFSGRIFLGSELNAGPELLLCLLKLGAEKVLVSHLDFLLTRVYPENYPQNHETTKVTGGWEVPEIEACRSMALNHPPFVQYGLFRFFWSRRLVVGSRAFENLMLRGVEDYSDRMDNIYKPTFGAR